MRNRRWSLLACVLLVVAAGRAGAGEAIDFQRDIRPILSNHCFRCHGPDEVSREGDLRLDTREGLFGQAAGEGVIVAPGNPAGSELWRRITAEDPNERMPPAGADKPLSPEQIARLEKWIGAGAPWRQHWAYEPPKKPEPPSVADTQWPRGPIDQFILAGLEREQLSPAPMADAATLARRLALDLTGLPPSRDDVEPFTRDPSDANYATLVERLLASPHFGERMAVYWLDLVRYADTCGYHSDVDQPISPYRDYVIRAFNENLPFDRFTIEQLAGDLLPEPSIEQRIASGYNRLNKTTEEGGAQAGEYLAKSAADRVRTAAGVWMAATLGCAECHDHKYDPFTARDFYSFAAFFADVKEEGVYSAGGRAPELPLPTAGQQAELSALDASQRQLKEQRAQLSDEDVLERREIDAELRSREAARKKLDREIVKTMVTVSTAPREMRVLPRGNWLDQSGPLVDPALPAFLAATARAERLTRLDLARWLVGADNPLTARVFVNRLWKLFFGAGIARSLDDLGSQGEPPTHPELLDWLAVEFRDSGWDVKHVIRLVVTSSAYRQSSAAGAELLARDPQNRLIARQGRWRLDAEFVRDQALATSGLLTRAIGGPSVKPYQPDGYWEFLNFPKRVYRTSGGDDQYRRGLYTHWQRTFLHPMLLAFDAPSREECTADRPLSNTPQAALALLNDPSFVECARAFGLRMINEGGADDRSRLAWGWRTALLRTPESEELDMLEKLLAASRERFGQHEADAAALLATGQRKPSTTVPPAELAAWSEAGRIILNLFEAISRN